MYSIREYIKTVTCQTAVQHGGLLDIKNPGCILYVSITTMFKRSKFTRNTRFIKPALVENGKHVSCWK